MTQTPIFTLLLAPPAWGKTTLLLELFQKQKGPWVYVSPLRALAEEFHSRARSLFDTFYLKSQSDLKDLVKGNFDLIVATPETLGEDGLQFLEEKKAFVVLDEIHLFYLWGESFRPGLKEFLFSVGGRGLSTLGLSATFEDKWRQKWTEDFSWAGYQLNIIDEGNFTWKYRPSQILYYGKKGRGAILRQLNKALKKEESCLLFCKTRSEVNDWLDFSKRRKIKAIGCVGGGVPQFLEELKEKGNPQLMVSTSVLGHGVNLPSFDHIFINHRVGNHSLWKQMAARGGRMGESFSLHCCDWPGSSFSERLYSRGQSLISGIASWL